MDLHILLDMIDHVLGNNFYVLQFWQKPLDDHLEAKNPFFETFRKSYDRSSFIRKSYDRNSFLRYSVDRSLLVSTVAY